MIQMKKGSCSVLSSLTFINFGIEYLRIQIIIRIHITSHGRICVKAVWYCYLLKSELLFDPIVHSIVERKININDWT
jgi:hypothetical protein